LTRTTNQLPIARHLPGILDLIRNNPVTVISGKTGCGKSTQVPKAIWKDNPKARIAICQPRRVAANSLAVRVAKELNSKLGDLVGFHIGNEAVKGSDTPIVYMTYGILIQ
jgi:HrpA-like RNA helicase